jgi:hypothetical protein
MPVTPAFWEVEIEDHDLRIKKLVRQHLNKQVGHGGACNPSYVRGTNKRVIAQAHLARSARLCLRNN